jgi:hypothetical protein
MLDIYNYLEQLRLYSEMLQKTFPYDKIGDIEVFLEKNLNDLQNKYRDLIISEYSKTRNNKNIFDLWE